MQIFKKLLQLNTNYRIIEKEIRETVRRKEVDPEIIQARNILLQLQQTRVKFKVAIVTFLCFVLT